MVNYFELFELPFGFNVNLSELRNKYLANSRKYHPDLVDDVDQQRNAEEQSSINNKGYGILKDFFETVPYILRFKGLLIEGEKETLDPEFLEEMMKINEGLMELEMDFNQETLDKLRSEEESRLAAIEKSLKDKAQRFDAEQDETLLDDIKTDYLKRKYLLRIKDSIDKFATS